MKNIRHYFSLWPLTLVFACSLFFYWSCSDSNGDTVEPDTCYFGESTLTDTSTQENSYYLNSYEFIENAGTTIYAWVESENFIPQFSLYYGTELIQQVEGEEGEKQKGGGTAWIAYMETTVEQTGSYHLVVSTTEQGETGDFILRLLSNCCENLIETSEDPLFYTDWC